MSVPGSFLEDPVELVLLHGGAVTELLLELLVHHLILRQQNVVLLPEPLYALPRLAHSHTRSLLYQNTNSLYLGTCPFFK